MGCGASSVAPLGGGLHRVRGCQLVVHKGKPLCFMGTKRQLRGKELSELSNYLLMRVPKCTGVTFVQLQAPIPKRRKYFYQVAAKVRDMGMAHDNLFHVEGRNHLKSENIYEFGVIENAIVCRHVPTNRVKPEFWESYEVWRKEEETWQEEREARIKEMSKTHIPFSRNAECIE